MMLGRVGFIKILNTPEGRSPERSEGEKAIIPPLWQSDEDRFRVIRLLFSGFILWKQTMR